MVPVDAEAMLAIATVALHCAPMGDGVEENLALMRRGNELWNTDGVEAVAARIWAPDIVFRDAPEFPDARVHHGVEAVLARMHEFIEAGAGQIGVRSLEGGGDWVLAKLEMRALGPASGAPVTAPYCNLVRFEAGRAREIRAYMDDDEARRAYERLAGPPK